LFFHTRLKLSFSHRRERLHKAGFMPADFSQE
jgi:hypothetical protein